MNPLTRRALFGATSAAALGLAAGCSAGGSEASARRTMTFAMPVEPTLSKTMQVVNGNNPWQHLVFDYLTMMDDDLKPAPQLATAWEWSEDRLSLRLTLRDDVTFHSGRPFTAGDVVYALQQAAVKENGSQVSGVAANIADLQVQQDGSLVIVQTKPNNRIFELFELTPMVDRESFPDYGKGAVVGGTGPYRWGSYAPGASVNLSRNESYWGGVPPVEDVTVLVLKQSQALIASARSGRSQITDGLSPLDASTVEGVQGLTVNFKGGIQCYVVGLDASTAPFSDVAARQAVAKCFDRDRIKDQVFRGHGKVTNLWWDDNVAGWDETTNTRWGYDPDTGRAELAALGLAGTRIPVAVNSGDFIARTIFDIVRNNLEDVGLVVEPEILEAATFIERNVAGTLGTCFVHATGFGSLSAVAAVTATAHLKPDGGTHFTSEEYTGLIAKASAAGDDAARTQANAALGEYLVDQAFNLPLVLNPGPVISAGDLAEFTMTNAFHYVLPASVRYQG